MIAQEGRKLGYEGGWAEERREMKCCANAGKGGIICAPRCYISAILPSDWLMGGRKLQRTENKE